MPGDDWDTATDNVTMKFKRSPPGRFMMGCPRKNLIPVPTVKGRESPLRIKNNRAMR